MTRGWTKKACHGCGRSEDYAFRKKDELCGDCQNLIQEAKDNRERLKNDQDLVPALLGGCSHYNAHIQVKGSRTASGRDGLYTGALQKALWRLAESFCIPDPEQKAILGRTYLDKSRWRYDVCVDELMGSIEGLGNEKYRLCKAETKEAFQDLYQIILKALHACYYEGKSYGQNLLIQLHSGQIHINEFNQELDRDQR